MSMERDGAKFTTPISLVRELGRSRPTGTLLRLGSIAADLVAQTGAVEAFSYTFQPPDPDGDLTLPCHLPFLSGEAQTVVGTVAQDGKWCIEASLLSMTRRQLSQPEIAAFRNESVFRIGTTTRSLEILALGRELVFAPEDLPAARDIPAEDLPSFTYQGVLRDMAIGLHAVWSDMKAGTANLEVQ